MNHTMASKQFKELSRGSDQNSPADLCRLGQQGKWKQYLWATRRGPFEQENKVCPQWGNRPLEPVTEMTSADSQAWEGNAGRGGSGGGWGAGWRLAAQALCPPLRTQCSMGDTGGLPRAMMGAVTPQTSASIANPGSSPARDKVPPCTCRCWEATRLGR